MPWGPWVMPPVQVSGVIDQDGTVLNWPHSDWSEPIVGVSSSNGATIRDEAARHAYFGGDDIATVNAEIEHLLKVGGSPPVNDDYSRTNTGGHQLYADAQVAGWPSPGNILHQASTYQLAHFNTPFDYYPPEYSTDPNITDIEHDSSGFNTMIDSWIAVAAWTTQSEGPVDTSGGDPYASEMTMVITQGDLTWEGTYYTYFTSGLARWFDPSVGLVSLPPGGIQGTTLTETATPGLSEYEPNVDDFTLNPTVQPLVFVHHLGSAPALDSHRCIPVAGFLACVRDGLGTKWPWILTNTGSSIHKGWSAALVPHGVIQFQPRMYRLFYTHLPTNWGVDYVRMATM